MARAGCSTLHLRWEIHKTLAFRGIWGGLCRANQPVSLRVSQYLPSLATGIPSHSIPNKVHYKVVGTLPLGTPDQAVFWQGPGFSLLNPALPKYFVPRTCHAYGVGLPASQSGAREALHQLLHPMARRSQEACQTAIQCSPWALGLMLGKLKFLWVSRDYLSASSVISTWNMSFFSPRRVSCNSSYNITSLTSSIPLTYFPLPITPFLGYTHWLPATEDELLARFHLTLPPSQDNCAVSLFGSVLSVDVLYNTNAIYSWASLVVQLVNKPPAMWETWVLSLGWEDPLEKGTATHSSILAWRSPWTEKPGRLQSMGSKRVRHDWATFTFTSLSWSIYYDYFSFLA